MLFSRLRRGPFLHENRRVGVGGNPSGCLGVAPQLQGWSLCVASGLTRVLGSSHPYPGPAGGRSTPSAGGGRVPTCEWGERSVRKRRVRDRVSLAPHVPT